MRPLFAFLFLYLLFIIQAGFLPQGPDLALLALIVFALHENRLLATILGFFAGLLFDLVTPNTFGIKMLTYSTIGYGVALLHNLFYRSPWQPVLFTFIGILFKTGLESLAGTRPQPLTLLLAITITLILSPFAEPGLARIFYKEKER
ncbi:MAG: rod shape-determining protein MreD [candidate division WOR-3 bacterium]